MKIAVCSNVGFVVVAIVFIIVLGYSFNKVPDFWLVGITVFFVLITVTRSQRNEDKFYLMVEREIQIWPKVLVKKLTMQCTKMKTHTDACYPCKITRTDLFCQV